MKQIEDILDIAKTVHLEEQLREESLSWYKDFEKFVTPLVREKFNIPRFEMQYFQMGMVGAEVKSFIKLEEAKYLETMKQDEKITEVIFRKYPDGEVLAILPYEIYNHRGNVVSYMKIGQHSEADYSHVVQTTKLATKEEYLPLKIEMEQNLGYNIKVIKRRYYDKYLKALSN